MCECNNNTNTQWEPESLDLFRKLAEGRFPLNRDVKDALDSIVKLAKTGQKSLSLIASGDRFSHDELRGRIPQTLLVNDTPKSSGFMKTGSTDAERLASDTVFFTEEDGTILAPNSIIVVIF